MSAQLAQPTHELTHLSREPAPEVTIAPVKLGVSSGEQKNMGETTALFVSLWLLQKLADFATEKVFEKLWRDRIPQRSIAFCLRQLAAVYLAGLLCWSRGRDRPRS